MSSLKVSIKQILGRREGQATLELVAILPLVAIVAVGIFVGLAFGAAREAAGNAATSGAVALIQGSDPEEAAEQAVAERYRKLMKVKVKSGEVTVRITVPVPVIGKRLSVVSEADSGGVS